MNVTTFLGGPTAPVDITRFDTSRSAAYTNSFFDGTNLVVRTVGDRNRRRDATNGCLLNGSRKPIALALDSKGLGQVAQFIAGGAQQK